MSDNKPLTYQQAGVDPDKAGRILSNFADFLKTRPRDPALLSGIGPFASCYRLKDLVGDLDDPLLVTCCDGVGTKAKLALEWGKLDGLGQDLVAMNVNDLLCTGAKPILFLDYYACGKLDDSQLTQILKSIQGACEESLCSLAGGETAEMPGVYAGEDFDLAGFAVGIVDRGNLLEPARVKAGDRLLAIESSGLHSNGFSLVRKLLERERISPDAESPVAGKSWKELLLTPTHLYVRPLLEVLEHVHAAAHITGGGLFENLPRVLPRGHRAVVHSDRWPIPEPFAWIQKKAGISTQDLLSTLNCGVGMILVVSPSSVTQALERLAKHRLRAWDIGELEANGSDSASVEWR